VTAYCSPQSRPTPSPAARRGPCATPNANCTLLGVVQIRHIGVKALMESFWHAPYNGRCIEPRRWIPESGVPLGGLTNTPKA
jgi:hypothetical protein